MRVPGSQKSLLQAKAQGADIRIVYSPLDSLQLARENPNKEVIFFGLGFETTAPSTALTILQAEAQELTNFSLFSNHVLVISALEALLDNPDLQLDGFISPGHVSMVIGVEPYTFIAEQYRKPLVVSGFEPLDILQSVWMILKPPALQKTPSAPAWYLLRALALLITSTGAFQHWRKSPCQLANLF